MSPAIVLAAVIALSASPIPPSCEDGSIPDEETFCREPELPIGDEALAILDGEDSALLVEGDTLLWLERRSDPEPVATGAFPYPLMRLTEDVYGARYRLRCPEEAIIDQYRIDDETGRLSRSNLYVGPDAPSLPERRAITGSVDILELEAQALGETRRVAVWLPPSYEADTAYPLLLLADGQGLPSQASLFEHLLEASTLPPFVAVGIFSGPAGIAKGPPREDIRHADYLPGFDGQDGFARHLSWVADELIPWLAERYGVSTDPSDVALAGKSNGAVFALEAGSRRPEVIGHVIAQSPGWEPITVTPSPHRPDQRFYLAAGLYEKAFLDTTMTNYMRLSATEARVALSVSATGHSAPIYGRTLLDGLRHTMLGGGTGETEKTGPCVSSFIGRYGKDAAEQG